ncbi:uncharacterized protein LOC120623777 [Pararge aegeria]|uniref:uncharacterized protein LOC120623777 n=1 Tax=Pararge aegeria TaxID=116150 RepID=UPI0019D2ADAE|nr:uncharacterized protein LOC120623777 [Pararge aegeria]
MSATRRACARALFGCVVAFIGSTSCAAVGSDVMAEVAAPSALQTFLKLISGYDADDADYAWPQRLRTGRREPYRVASLPLLLLPVALQDSREFDQYEVGANRRRLAAEYDADEDSGRAERAPRRPARPAPPGDDDDRAAPLAATFPPAESSQRLVEQFRAQVPSDPSQPPILQSAFDASERLLLVDDGEDGDNGDERDDSGDGDAGNEVREPTRRARALVPGARGNPLSPGARGSPPPPRFERPLKLRALLTVPRADYSETYTVWWNPENGDSRIHFQDGSAGAFRKLLPNGLVQRVEMHVDRSGAGAVRRCGVSTVAEPAARAHPALPDLQLFAFAGYDELGAERWQHRAAAGGARGEALSALHELLVRREADDSVRPLRYRVAVNSSVLGADCDGYQHLYLDARHHNRGPEFFEADLAELCDEVRPLGASEPALQPLREFTRPHDAQHDAARLQRFKQQHGRQYADDAEEAVRQNLLRQSARFVAAGNRAGASFRLGLNLLADRLHAEARGLRGVARDGERRRAERFPHARRALPALQRRLPARFDWRARGGVSPVRFQGATCASCWAFAAAGAVEGALFRRSGRLTPLSEQQLVDCAHEFGARGCGGTWPSRAYDYVQERGLAALDDYAPYEGEVQACRAAPAAARISGHVNVTKHSVPALQVAIQQHGPAVVIVDSSPKSFTLYKAGVLYDERCSKKSAKHAVLAVGWGQEKGEPHFILKNSWSDAWGERGYVRVQARANTCGVLTHPSYPRLEDDDVL